MKLQLEIGVQIIMAKCSNCGYKLKITDWRPECPKCGVNLMYFRMEERLREDADKAELEYAKSQPTFDRLKASIYGNPWSIVRLVFLVLPLLSLLLPLGKIAVSLPFYNGDVTVNAISVYNALSNMDLNALLTLTGSELLGLPVRLFLASLVFLLLTVLLILVEFVCVIFSFSKGWFSRNITLACMGIVFSSVSAVLFSLSCKHFHEIIPEFFDGAIGIFGVCAVILTFILVILVNVLIKVKKIEVKYTDVSEYFLPYHERPSVIAAEKAAQEQMEKASQKENVGSVTA